MVRAERRRRPLVADPAAVEDIDPIGEGQHEVDYDALLECADRLRAERARETRL
jgi:hypothetical protein